MSFRSRPIISNCPRSQTDENHFAGNQRAPGKRPSLLQPGHNKWQAGRQAARTRTAGSRAPRDSDQPCHKFLASACGLSSMAMVTDSSDPISTTKIIAFSVRPNHKTASGSQQMLGRLCKLTSKPPMVSSRNLLLATRRGPAPFPALPTSCSRATCASC